MLNFASGDQLIWLKFMSVMRMRNPLAFESLHKLAGGLKGGMRNCPTLAPYTSAEGWPCKYQQALTQAVSQFSLLLQQYVYSVPSHHLLKINK